MSRPSVASKTVLAAFVAVLLTSSSGCQSLQYWLHNDLKVGPNYGVPAAPVAESFSEVGSPRMVSDSLSDPRWWNVFNDPDLDFLIQRAYEQSLTLKQAAARIDEARAVRNIQASSLLPQQSTASGAYARNQNNALGPPVSSDLWSTGFNSSWELDLWGKIRRNLDASEAQLCASVKDYDYALVTLISDVATLYIQIRAAEERIELAEINIKAFKGSLRVAKDRAEEEVASPLDVAQAESNLLATRALIPNLEFTRRQAINSLSVLLAIPPSEVTFLGLAKGRLPELPAEVLVGIPAELLRRRPDIRSAERNLKAQFESIGIAEADLYPSFSIGGNLGYQAPEIRDLFATSSFTGGISPSFNWNVLNFGKIKNQVCANEAQFNQLRYNFENLVLQAQQEVETAMYDFITSHQLLEINVANERANVEAARIVTEQFKAGDVDFGRVFVVQANLVQAQDQVVVTRAAIALALVNTYRSLGGGWGIRCGNGTIPYNVVFETEVVSPVEQLVSSIAPVDAPLPEEAASH